MGFLLDAFEQLDTLDCVYSLAGICLLDVSRHTEARGIPIQHSLELNTKQFVFLVVVLGENDTGQRQLGKTIPGEHVVDRATNFLPRIIGIGETFLIHPIDHVNVGPIGARGDDSIRAEDLLQRVERRAKERIGSSK